VPYRETVLGHGRAEGRYVRQTGGHGQYAKVTVEVDTNERGADFGFHDKTVGGVVPKNFIP
jgi:elongation factor G